MQAVSISEFFALVTYRLKHKLEVDVDAPIIDSLTPLHLAAMHDRLDLVKLLLANRATVDPVTTEWKWPPLHFACERGYVGVAAALLAHRANVNAVTSESRTPLHIAVEQGSVEVVDLLIAKQASIDAATSEGATPLFIAAQHGHVGVVSALLKNNANVDAALETGETPLNIACDRGHASVVSALVAGGAGVDSPNIDGQTPLQTAAGRGRLDVVLALLASREDVNGAILRGAKALNLAAQQGNAETVSTLLAAQVDANLEDENGWTSLHAAAQQGHVEVVVALLANNANVNVANLDGSTPLHSAAWSGHLQVVRVLLDKNASVDVADVHGATPLHASAQSGHLDIVELLLNRQASVDTADVSDMTALFVAAGQGHVDVVIALLAARANVDAADEDGWTPLHMATKNGHVGVVSALLATGRADVNAVTSLGSTPLSVAAILNQTSVVAVLLANRANVNLSDAGGFTPLHAAARWGHVTIVELLLKSQASVNAVDMSGSTPLAVAVSSGHTRVVELLLSHQGAATEQQDGEAVEPVIPAAEVPANAADSNDQFLLHLAAQNGDAKLMEILLKRGACVDALSEGNTSVTALHIAAAMGHEDVTSVLLERGANVDAVAVVSDKPETNGNAGATPLHLAARNGHINVLRILLAKYANVEAVMKNGETPLHTAARARNVDVLQALLENGANVDAADGNGATALHYAARIGDKAVIEQLLSRQANLDAVTVNGATPLHIAAQHGQVETITRLLVATQAKRDQASGSSDHARSCELVEADGVAVAAAGISTTVACEQTHRGVAYLETPDKNGNSPVLAAAKMGRFDAVQALIEVGALAHARAADGETVLTAAARHRNIDVVSLLLDLGCLTPSSTANGELSLLSATLLTLRAYEGQTHEFKALWLRTVDRLTRIFERLDEGASREIIFEFAMSVSRIVRLKSRCSETGIFTRLVASPSIATAFRDLHTELAFLERRIDSESHNPAGNRSSETECGADEAALLTIFQEKITGAASFEAIQHDRGIFLIEDATMIRHFVRENGDKVSQELLDLLEASVSKILEIVGVKDSPPVPNWFIPSHERDLNWIRSDAPAAIGYVSTGTWLSSAVTISQHSMQHAQFIDIVERCFPLQHPNVVKVFGAWHLHQPFAAIYESVSHTNLRKYLAREENKQVRWQRLHEVALGLKYLIERDVVVESLTCAHIWVGTDGTAKINALTACATSQEDSGLESVRWQAPEVIQGATPFAASGIYSLAMCIYEALSGEIPWEARSVHLVAFDSLGGFRPQLPDGLTDAQRNLVERMWLTDPSKRPSITNVVERLKLMAAEEEKAHGKFKDEKLTVAEAWVDVEKTVIPELGYAIKNSLESLEGKCEFYRESQDSSVQHIVKRIRSVYNLVRKLDHLPATSPIIGLLCDVMQSLYRFLGNPYHVNSMLLRAKSQKVTLKSNVFHRRLDELLDLLAPKVVDSIHTWKQQAKNGTTQDSSGTPQPVAPVAGASAVSRG